MGTTIDETFLEDQFLRLAALVEHQANRLSETIQHDLVVEAVSLIFSLYHLKAGERQEVIDSCDKKILNIATILAAKSMAV